MFHTAFLKPSNCLAKIRMDKLLRSGRYSSSVASRLEAAKTHNATWCRRRLYHQKSAALLNARQRNGFPTLGTPATFHYPSSSELYTSTSAIRPIDFASCSVAPAKTNSPPDLEMDALRTTLSKSLHNAPLLTIVNKIVDDLLRVLREPSFVRSQKPQNPFERSAEKPKEESSSSEDSDKKKDPKKEPPSWFSFVLSVALGLLAYYMMMPSSEDEEGGMFRYISWNEFVTDMLSRGEVNQIVILPDADLVQVQLYPGASLRGAPTKNSTYLMKIEGVERFEEKLRHAEAELGIPEHGRVPVTYRRQSNLTRLIITLGILGGILWFLSRGVRAVSGQMGDTFKTMTKAKFTIIDPATPSSGKLTSFKDVAGMEEAKKEVLEFVGYLKDPTRFKLLGAKAPRGALLLGPPGCGKTLLAKAIAAESNVPFLSMAGSEFVEMIGGLGAARVRDLFKEARKRSPCIVYIDEIDAVGRKRSENSAAGGGSGEEEQTLNQMLVEMDGMTTTEGVIMLASTNRADILDKALLRPGRFDRRIDIDPPTASERKEIFEVYLKKLSLASDPSTYSQQLAARTPGMSCADIANVCNEAALHAAREGQQNVDTQNFDHAVERVVFGTEKKSKLLQNEERRIVATHEAGHALCGWLLEHTDALMKVSIVPRTNRNLGYSQTSPSDLKLYTKQQLFDRMCMALGGRVAELLVFNRVTTGAEDDLKRVTKMAYRQIRLYGMNETVGNLSYDVDMRQDGNAAIKPYSKALATIIDAEARKLVHEAFRTTEDLIRSHRSSLDRLSATLLEKEVLTASDVESLIGASPFPNKQKINPEEWERFTATEGFDPREESAERSRSPPPGDEKGDET